MSETNEVIKDRFSGSAFKTVDFTEAYLLRVGREKYVVRIEEKEIEIENSKRKLVKGYEATFYDVFDGSVFYVRKSELPLGRTFLYYRKESDLFGVTAHLYKIITTCKNEK